MRTVLLPNGSRVRSPYQVRAWKIGDERNRILDMMHRREALKRFGLSAAAAMLSPLRTRGEEAPDWQVAIGLNGFMSAGQKYQKQFPLWEILDYASEAGFDGVELVNGWPQGGYPAPTETERVRALKRLYDAYGLKIFSIQTGAGGAFAPSAEDRKRWVHGMRDQLKLAQALGCDCVGTWPGGGLRGQTIDQAIRHFAGSMREVALMGDDLGLTVAFEIEPPFVFRSEAHLEQILTDANDPRVKTIYDPSHFDLFNASSGRPHELLARIGVEHIGYVHFTDTDGTIRDGGTSKHLGAGDGHIDVAASFDTLRTGGFKGWIMIDTWQIPDPYNASTKGLRAVREAMR